MRILIQIFERSVGQILRLKRFAVFEGKGTNNLKFLMLTSILRLLIVMSSKRNIGFDLILVQICLHFGAIKIMLDFRSKIRYKYYYIIHSRQETTTGSGTSSRQAQKRTTPQEINTAKTVRQGRNKIHHTHYQVNDD